MRQAKPCQGEGSQLLVTSRRFSPLSATVDALIEALVDAVLLAVRALLGDVSGAASAHEALPHSSHNLGLHKLGTRVWARISES